MIKSCCCTGHRPQGFPFEYGKDKKRHKVYLKALEEKIKLAITEYGITNFKVHQQTPCSFTAGRLLYRKDK